MALVRKNGKKIRIEYQQKALINVRNIAKEIALKTPIAIALFALSECVFLLVLVYRFAARYSSWYR